MPSIEQFLVAHLVPFGAVLARMTGIFIFTPLLSTATLPVRFKALLAMALTVAVYPIVQEGGFPPQRVDLIVLAPVLAAELMIGAAIGVLAGLPFGAVQLSGLIMGQQMGLGLSQVINPAIDIEGDNLGQLLFILAIAIFVTMGGLESLLDALVSSFHLLPIGGLRPGDAPVDAMVALLTSGFELAFRVALPVLAIIFVESLVVGFLMKTVPSLNIMSFGFPVRILLGLAAVLAGVFAMRDAMTAELEYMVEVVREWTWAAGEGARGG